MPKQFVLGYVHNGQVIAAFMQAVLNFTTHDLTAGRKSLLHVQAAQGPYIYKNRNRIVEAFLDNTSADWLLFVDIDINFNHEQPYLLLDHADKDHQIVAGLYFSWLPLGDEYGLAPMWFESIDPMISTANLDMIPQPIMACGMGFTLLGRPMLEAMRRAWKFDPAPWFGHDVCTCTEHTKPERMGEDVTFCMRARSMGYQAWGVPTVVDHLKMHAENLASFERWNSHKQVWTSPRESGTHRPEETADGTEHGLPLRAAGTDEHADHEHPESGDDDGRRQLDLGTLR